MMSRRHVVAAAGASSLALVGLGGVYAVTRRPERAVAPWDLAAPVADPRLDALRHAILAPNPHNRQPWRIRLVGEDEALVECDLDRRLPETDPFDRQIVIGFGCFLELARIAATARGIRMSADLFPEGEPGQRLDRRPVARLAFGPEPGLRPDPLFDMIGARRSHKGALDARPVAADLLTALASEPAGPDVMLGGSGEPEPVAALRDLAMAAATVEFTTPRTYLETVRLMRIGAAEIDASPDGVSLGGPMMEALRLAGLLSREGLSGPGGAKPALDRYRSLTSTAQAFAWITTARNGRRDQIEAGRVYLRQNLQATSLGLAMSPLSQALQEFPEMTELRARLHRDLAPAGGTVQMLARLGYGPATPPSPRWPLAAKLAARAIA